MISLKFVSLFALMVVTCLAYPAKETSVQDDAETKGGHFEGDMILTPEQIAAIKGDNGIRQVVFRWDNKIVPYKISSTYSDEQKAYIRRALDTLELSTCLKFVPRTNQFNYISVVPGNGCSSLVGKYRGPQPLTLESYNPEEGCFRLSTIMHEFIHAIGFYHMQSTYDRDDYVHIKTENIQDGQAGNFLKFPAETVNDFGLSYDYESVMHYGPFAFSKNEQPTIITKDPSAKIGQRIGLSRKDIEKINRMYGCPLN